MIGGSRKQVLEQPLTTRPLHGSDKSVAVARIQVADLRRQRHCCGVAKVLRVEVGHTIGFPRRECISDDASPLGQRHAAVHARRDDALAHVSQPILDVLRLLHPAKGLCFMAAHVSWCSMGAVAHVQSVWWQCHDHARLTRPGAHFEHNSRRPHLPQLVVPLHKQVHHVVVRGAAAVVRIREVRLREQRLPLQATAHRRRMLVRLQVRQRCS